MKTQTNGHKPGVKRAQAAAAESQPIMINMEDLSPGKQVQLQIANANLVIAKLEAYAEQLEKENARLTDELSQALSNREQRRAKAKGAKQ